MQNVAAEIEVKVLEYNEGTYEGNAYSNVLARYNGKILKFKIKPNAGVDLTAEDVDQTLTLSLEITAGSNQAATPRIIGVTR